jgi:hypothetical protein
MSRWVLTAPPLQKRITRRLRVSQRHFGAFTRSSPPDLPRSAQPQLQNAAEPPEPRRIFAQDSSGFRYVFVRILVGFLP